MNRLSGNPRNRQSAQRGAVLFVALIFLVLLSLLAVVGMNTSLLQERMTGGMRNAHLAQMGADSTVRAAEFSLWNAPANNRNIECTTDGAGVAGGIACYKLGLGRSDGVNELGAVDGINILKYRAARGYVSPSIASAQTAPVGYNTSATPESARLAEAPSFLIEEMGRIGQDIPHSGWKPLESGPSGGVQPFKAFRITSRSTGGTQSVVRMAESVFITQVQPATTP